jgi:hypothetical protein
MTPYTAAIISECLGQRRASRNPAKDSSDARPFHLLKPQRIVTPSHKTHNI